MITAGKVDTLFHLTDWLPTVYTGLAGGTDRDLQNIDGVNQLDVLRGKSEPLRSDILYDIANYNASGYGYTHTTSPAWPDNLELTGAFGAALRLGEYKLVVGCATLTGCARNYNATWGGAADTGREQELSSNSHIIGPLNKP